MEHLLLVNRRARRKYAHHHRRRRNARRKRRMPAALARYWAAKRHRRYTRLTNPRRRRRRNARSFTMSRRRRRRNTHRRHHRVHRRVFRNRRHHRRHYRRLRNPRRSGGFSTRGLMRNAVVPAALGATGALVLDVVYGYLSPSLPVTFQSGWMATLVKGAAAVGLGMVGMRVMGRERGRVMMLGALTVTAYSALRTAVTGMGIPGLSGYADYTPYPMGAYMRGPTGTPGIQGLGYISPAAVVGPTLSPRMGAYMPMNVVQPMGDYGDGM